MDNTWDLEMITDYSGVIANHASEELAERMHDWLEKNPVEKWWDYDDKLSDNEIDTILEGRVYEVEWNIHGSQHYYMWESFRDKAVECIGEFQDELLAGLTLDPFLDMHAQEIAKLLYVPSMDKYLEYCAVLDISLSSLGDQTQPRLSVDLGVEHPSQYYKYYDEVEELLRLLCINPRTMENMLAEGVIKDSQRWPDMPERDGNEFVDPADLLGAWINMPYYSGEWIALCTADNIVEMGWDLYAASELATKSVKLPEGTNIIIHDRMNGASSTWLPLKKELVIELTGKHQLCRDARFKYGVDAVFGTLSFGVWDSPIELQVIEPEKEIVDEQSV